MKNFWRPLCFAKEHRRPQLLQLLIASSSITLLPPPPTPPWLGILPLNSLFAAAYSLGAFPAVILPRFSYRSVASSLSHRFQNPTQKNSANPCFLQALRTRIESPTHGRLPLAALDGHRLASHGLEIIIAISTWLSTSTGRL